VYFHRETNLDAVRAILTNPKIYPMMGDDFVPPREEFIPNDHPEIRYIIARNADYRRIGLFTLIPQNKICWEIHVAMLPKAPAFERWSAARQLIDWLRANTECQRLTASVPANNKPAIHYGVQGLGMYICGRQERAFQKNGKLEDLVILGRSLREQKEETPCQVSSPA